MKLLEDSEEKPKDYYLNYKYFINDLNDTETKIKNEMIQYKKKISSGGSTIEIENKIKTLLKYYKDNQNNLAQAYSSRNAPSGFPFLELDRRQKEIQQFGINYDNFAKEFHSNENERYKYKGEIDEDYSKKEEFQNMTSSELIHKEKQKLKNQDEQIEEITSDVKKNTQLAVNVKHVLKDQNKQLEEINEDMDRTKEKMNKLTNRFKNYASNLSWCKIIFVFIIELVIALAAYFLLFY